MDENIQGETPEVPSEPVLGIPSEHASGAPSTPNPESHPESTPEVPSEPIIQISSELTPKVFSESEISKVKKKRTKKVKAPLWIRLLRKLGWTLAIFLGLAVGPLVILLSVSKGLDAWSFGVPIQSLVSQPLPQQSVILASDGSVIANFFGENRIPVSGKDISAQLKDALIATEDSRFYHTNGVDWIATAHAFVDQLRGHPRGGSGITQQYVKNLLINHATSQADLKAVSAINLNRKIREAFLAMKVSSVLTKDQILTGYFNTVYFGDNTYGIGAAAKHYFDKTPADLTLAESALLVGIVQNPTGLNPSNHPVAAKNRRAHVLNRMQINGYITLAEEQAADAEPITLHIATVANGCSSSPYPFYCQWIRDTLSNSPEFGATPELRQALLYKGGLTIKTALVPSIQNKSDKVAKGALDPKNNIADALAIIEPGTGKVVAISTNEVWGNGPGHTQLVLPAIANFQPGSTFKPITVATALEEGINPNYSFSVGSYYTPLNRNSPVGGFTNAEAFSGGYLSMTQALAQSVNTWFVSLEDKIGVKAIAATGYKMGMTSLPLNGPKAITERDAALTLGAYETSPIQLASVYATIAAHGVACAPIGITSVVDANGKSLSIPQANCKQVIRVSTADTLAQMMTSVVKYGTGVNANIPGREVAGKTGTTSSAAAAWFAGFTPQYASAVWIGDPRGGYQYPLHSVVAYGQTWEPVWGGGVPATIWKNLMTSVLQGLPAVKLASAGGDAYVGSTLLVPDVRGMTLPTATKVLSDYGYSVVLSPTSGVATPGMGSGIVSQTLPKAGDKIPSDKSRTIILSVTK